MQTVQKKLHNYSSKAIREALAEEQTLEADQSRLEALKVLSYSILSEVESLKRGKSKNAPVRIDLITEVQNYEASLIRCALMRTGGNQRRAARLLNINSTTLNAKIKRLGIMPNGLSPNER